MLIKLFTIFMIDLKWYKSQTSMNIQDVRKLALGHTCVC